MLNIAASPVLSRLYGPGDFGLLSVYGSLISIVTVVSSLAYQQAIPAPDSHEDGANLTALSLTLVAFASLLSALGAALFHERLERYFAIPGFATYVAAVPVGVLGASAYEVLSQWAARKKAFGLIAKTSAQRSVLQTGIQLAGGFAKFGTVSLVVGQLFGQWGGTLQVARRSWQADAPTFRRIDWGTMWDAARRFRRFPAFTLPGAVLNAIDSNAAPLLFAHFFGATVTGYFALGNRLVSIPFMLVGSSAQRVFYPAAAAARHNGSLATETNETFHRLLRIVLPIVFVMTACAPELFVVLMGAKWREAGVYMQWLSLRACFTMLVFPLTPLIFVLNRQAVGTLFSGVQLVVRVGSVYVGARYGDARLAVALLGVGTGLLWLGYLIYLMSISGNRIPLAIAQLIRESVIAGLITSPILAAKLVHASDLLVTLTAGLASLIGVIVVARRFLSAASPTLDRSA
ncbi:MAG: oligosaccharide flippase family protein [Polyangiaceae bacterium]